MSLIGGGDDAEAEGDGAEAEGDGAEAEAEGVCVSAESLAVVVEDALFADAAIFERIHLRIAMSLQSAHSDFFVASVGLPGAYDLHFTHRYSFCTHGSAHLISP